MLASPSSLFFLSILFLLGACRSDEEVHNIVEKLVSEYGYIAHHNPVQLFATGSLVSGGPTNLRLDAEASDCFPYKLVSRHLDKDNFHRQHHYTTSGGLEILGIGATSSHVVDIELGGISIEHLTSFDITSWYRNPEGMDDLCREYLNYATGLITEVLTVGYIKISFTNESGADVVLNNNILSLLPPSGTTFSWRAFDEYTLEITTPINLGYRLVRLRQDDSGLIAWRATGVEDGEFIFEDIGIEDEPDHKIVSDP